MALPTTTDIETVDDGTGSGAPPANKNQQQQTNDRLGNFPNLTQLEVTTSGTTAETLPDVSVPQGVEVLVEYRESNTGTVYVGDSDTQKSALATVGDARVFRVENTSAVYVRTPTAGDGVIVTFEVN